MNATAEKTSTFILVGSHHASKTQSISEVAERLKTDGYAAVSPPLRNAGTSTLTARDISKRLEIDRVLYGPKSSLSEVRTITPGPLYRDSTIWVYDPKNLTE